MTTKQLAIYIIAGLAVFTALFGLIPPLLNAQNSLMNAIGVGLVVVVFLAAILMIHANHKLDKQSQPPTQSKE